MILVLLELHQLQKGTALHFYSHELTRWGFENLVQWKVALPVARSLELNDL